MRRNGPELQRVVVDTARDDEGYYFSMDGGEYVGPFATEEDRDGEIGTALRRIAARRRRPGTGSAPGAGGRG